ncbi:uroporphyrinogen-III C-methyltransferase [Listeria aquatica]|uniref:uroporphyrinogen-III C-methyltransferase n=2 Tax=Listeria aquatica TaxID=1494960 RepID=W7AVH6_9LIST|nr:uroporphyrinogen-III C-methyltransferase [Listeria aquatica]EUJ17230.1 bifunctional uroporphyrinogen-III methyltransferase/uroporphyrinogen-III synthase [Listeria aquatica FSL S10-1188]
MKQKKFIANFDDLPEKIGYECLIDGEKLAVFRLNEEEVRIISNVCPHKQGPLAEGTVSGEFVFCPLHDYKISLVDGKVQEPDEGCVKTYDVCIENKKSLCVGVTEMGKVYLVGAGSGDPELLTLKALRVLQQADVVLYDRLVNPLLLYHTKQGAKLVFCGKSPDRHAMRQEIIGERLVQEAEKNQVIVRLKGGDPGIFGRVAEEITQLEKAKIAYEVVPGITAASAASCYAGISLTDREASSHVTLSTAHRKTGALTEDDFASFVRHGTACFYMGMENLPHIVRKLLDGGISSEMHVAVISWGSYGRQKMIKSTLARIEREVAASDLRNPALILIGEVVARSNDVSWFMKLPLFGQRYLLVSKNPVDFDVITRFTGQGADVWFVQVGEKRDIRFDEITKRYLNEQSYPNLLFLEPDAKVLWEFQARGKKLHS